MENCRKGLYPDLYVIPGLTKDEMEEIQVKENVVEVEEEIFDQNETQLESVQYNEVRSRANDSSQS